VLQGGYAVPTDLTTINTTVFIYSGKKENEVGMFVRVNLRR
jgi:hypothetical protein